MSALDQWTTWLRLSGEFEADTRAVEAALEEHGQRGRVLCATIPLLHAYRTVAPNLHGGAVQEPAPTLGLVFREREVRRG